MAYTEMMIMADYLRDTIRWVYTRSIEFTTVKCIFSGSIVKSSQKFCVKRENKQYNPQVLGEK